MVNKKRKYGEGSIFLRKDGRWEGRVVVGYKENGNPKTKSVTAKTQSECKEKLQVLKEQCGRTTDRLKPDMPFGDWMDFWFQNFSKPKIRETTMECYENRIRRFLIQAQAEGYYELFLLELTTGMRRGEILGLQWKDVNLDTGELHIRRQVVKKGAQTLISKPKTKSSIRTILLPPRMVEILAELKKTATCDWVFPSPVKEGEPRNPDSLYGRFQKILQRAQCKKVRFHDLRHTFATMALENGMDIKTLSAMIGHISTETTLNIYSHITDTMQKQAAVKIDREIGGTDALMPEPEPPKVSEQAQATATPESKFEPYKSKIRKPSTGCVTMINDHLYEGRFSPRVNGKRISKNIYAKTREECEEKLAELIKTMKAEIAAEKKKAEQA